jgi:hypothetical protein
MSQTRFWLRWCQVWTFACAGFALCHAWRGQGGLMVFQLACVGLQALLWALHAHRLDEQEQLA